MYIYMKKALLRISHTIATICCILMVTVTVLMVEGILFEDDDPYKAMGYCGERSQDIHWRSWDGREYECQIHISDEEFEASMLIPIKRYENMMGFPYKTFLTPQNEHIQKIAEYLCSLTNNEVRRALYALNFTQCAIEYATDEEVYHASEHFARPIETLYIGRGDCEDKAFLTCSIMLAMGLDAHITNEKGHVGVALHIDRYIPRPVKEGIQYEGKTYYVCDISASYPTYLFKDPTGEEYIISEDDSVLYTVADMTTIMVISLRYGSSKYLDWIGIEGGFFRDML
ncbi:MAG: hypothetical protein IIY21_04220 [Clostridiales bacterium]|nr:hypothetical protein [Clostridiales bacterium]